MTDVKLTDDETVLREGDSIPFEYLHEHYAGPEGTVAIITPDSFPEGFLMFIKEHRIIRIIERSKITSMEDFQRELPLLGTYDGVVCNPDEGPEATMSEEWNREAQAAARAKFQ